MKMDSWISYKPKLERVSLITKENVDFLRPIAFYTKTSSKRKNGFRFKINNLTFYIYYKSLFFFEIIAESLVDKGKPILIKQRAKPVLQTIIAYKIAYSKLFSLNTQFKEGKSRYIIKDPIVNYDLYKYVFNKDVGVDELITFKENLSDKYYNEGTSPLVDSQYDMLEGLIKGISSKEANAVGAPVANGDKIKLPYVMGSLEKIKPSQGKELTKWLNKIDDDIVTLAKIDGLGVQLVYENGRLVAAYTRGDGYEGKSIIHHLKYAHVPKNLGKIVNCVIRAEIVLRKVDFEKYFKKSDNNKQGFVNPRNMVAGMMNRKDPTLKGIGKYIYVVAYEIMGSRLDKATQLDKLLNEFSFVVPDYKIISKSKQNAIKLEAEFVKKIASLKEDYPFEIDGIVLEANVNRQLGFETGGINPKYARAFKSDAIDNKAETEVVKVEWNVTKDGYLKPVVIIKPVFLSGATITRVTAFNAAYIKENRINIGAKILVTRSNDVIPYILEVLAPAKAWARPDASYNATWNETGVDLIISTKEENRELNIQKLIHFFKKAEVDNLSDGLITRLYDNGYTSILEIVSMTIKDFMKIEGIQNTLASKLVNNIKSALNPVDLPVLMAASGCFGRNFGETKLEKLYQEFGEEIVNFSGMTKTDIAANIANVHGFSLESGKQFANGLPVFKKFLSRISPYISLKKTTKISGSNLSGVNVAFTGFRDKTLAEKVKQLGGYASDNITKATNVLLVPNNTFTSIKVEKARDSGVAIMTSEEFTAKYKV